MERGLSLLLSPFQIRKYTLKNRLVFLPHGSNYADANLPSERLIHYYEERAKGGAALIVVPMVIQSRTKVGNDLFGFDERGIEGLTRLAEAVHSHGAYIFAQITHYGNQGVPGLTLEEGDWKPLLAPSPVPDALIQQMPKEIEEEDFEALKEAYIQVAKNAKSAGMDGIDVNMGHASLLRQFLSPMTNNREDRYGGSLESRMRFPVEVIKLVREEAGNDLCVGIRLCMDEFAPGGLTLDDTKEIAQELESAGLIDILFTDLGTYMTPHMMNPPMSIPLGYAVSVSAALRENVDIPVVAFGRIVDPHQAEKILTDGHADLIGMAREFICDPEFANKVAADRTDDIRLCMACNQGCTDRIYMRLPVTCTQNPSAGREATWGIGSLKKTQKSKSVVVVGGGPAGMKAAEVAAVRGHKVVIIEKQEKLGGNVLVFTRIPNRGDFVECIRYIERQIKGLPVEVVLGQEADENSIKSLNPEVVIMASGATPQISDIPGVDLSQVGTVSDLLIGNLVPGESIVIVDTEGFWPGMNAAEYLLDQKKKVQVVTTFPFFGMNIGFPSLVALNGKLFSQGLGVIPNTYVKEIGPDYIRTMNIWSQEEYEVAGVDTVVMATGFKANDELYKSLRKEIRNVYRIGDCLAPRRVDHAIYEGECVGRMV